MTLVYEVNLDILKMYLRTKNEVSSQGFQKSNHKQDRQTHRRTETDGRDRKHYKLYLRVVTIIQQIVQETCPV